MHIDIAYAWYRCCLTRYARSLHSKNSGTLSIGHIKHQLQFSKQMTFHTVKLCNLIAQERRFRIAQAVLFTAI